jgi:hypothetical protein
MGRPYSIREELELCACRVAQCDKTVLTRLGTKKIESKVLHALSLHRLIRLHDRCYKKQHSTRVGGST